MSSTANGLLRALTVAVVALVAAPTASAATPFAPLDRDGPKLSVSKDRLRSSLNCGTDVGRSSPRPVLLVHGTSVTVRENWSHFYIPALERRGRPWCTVSMPNRATDDIQMNAEYVVHAIRAVNRRSGQRIAIIGASQGGMVPRWAFRFWPNTRPLVADLIGLAPSNHGSTVGICDDDACPPAGWQQRADSDFMRALNSRQETFNGIPYTNIYTHTDETVKPNMDDTGSSSLHGDEGLITNVAIQDICPLAISEHLLVGFADPIAWTLAMDAVDHRGPADESGVAERWCLQPGMPGDLTDAFEDLLNAVLLTPGAVAPVAAEPRLRCYVKAACHRR